MLNVILNAAKNLSILIAGHRLRCFAALSMTDTSLRSE